MAECGKAHGSGRVVVRVTVEPKGDVSDVVVVRTAPDSDLGRCVAEAVRKATFRATRKGGSFTYPFVFR